MGLGSLIEATARERSALEGGGLLTRAHDSLGMDMVLYPEEDRAAGTAIRAGSMGAREKIQ